MALYELDEFQGPQFLGYVRNIPVSEAYQGARWLPNQNVDDLSFEYLKGINKRTVMASVMAYDSEAPIAGRVGVGERVTGELPPIKRKQRISEREIIRFLQPRAGTADKQSAINTVYDTTDDLVNGIQARVEWLRMQALTENTVVYDEGGVTFEFDYGINNALQFVAATGQDANGAAVPGTTAIAWSDTANANPLDDVQAWVNAYATLNGGNRPTEFTLSRKALQYALSSAKLRTLIRGANSPTAILTRAELQGLFDQYELPTLNTYDVTVTKENADGTLTDVRPMAQNKAFFCTPGQVGNTLWGPTAESRVLIGTPLANQAPGIIAVPYATQEPPAEWVKAAAIAFPTMPNAQLLGQATLF